MTPLDCVRCRELLPELALGIADGDDRASVLEHLSVCIECQRELEALSATADSLFVVGPEAEPPAGFESRVTDALDVRRPPRRVLPTLVAAAAAVLLFAVGLGAGWAVFHEDEPEPERGPVPADRILQGELVAADGSATGDILGIVGDSSVLVVDVAADSLPAGTYTVECDYGDGYTVDLGEVETEDGERLTWVRAIPVPIDGLVGVRLVDAEGEPGAEAAVS